MITFQMRLAGEAALAIYDVQGRLVRTLLDAALPVGVQSVTWDGFDEAGRPVPSGPYFYRLSSGDRQESRALFLLK